MRNAQVDKADLPGTTQLNFALNMALPHGLSPAVQLEQMWAEQMRKPSVRMQLQTVLYLHQVLWDSSRCAPPPVRCPC